MMDRDLKYYNRYLKKLYKFAQGMDIKLSIIETYDEGVWSPATKTIKIDESMSQSQIIATILHELGHAIDDLNAKTYSEETYLWKAYSATYDGKPTDKQKNTVVESEKRAWSIGKEIAKRLNIRLGKWYDEVADHCIKAYRSD